MPQRRMGQCDMSKRGRVERPRKQSDSCRKSVKSSQELHLSSYESGTFSHNLRNTFRAVDHTEGGHVTPATDQMTDLRRASDEELLSLSSSGNEDAFTMLYHRRNPSVYRFALHMSGRPDLAEEVTQEVFLVLIRDPDCYDAKKGALSSFLIGVARNCVLRYLERDRRHVLVEDPSDFDAEAEGFDLLADLTREQASETVRQAVLSLPQSTGKRSYSVISRNCRIPKLRR